MSDISVSERRLSAALDRIDQFLDRGGVVAAGSGSELRAELEAAQAQIGALTERLGQDDMADRPSALPRPMTSLRPPTAR